MNVSLTTGKAKLNYAMKSLIGRWDDTKEHWQDAVSRDFEEKYLEPLAPQMATTIRGIDHLAQLFVAAEQECS